LHDFLVKQSSQGNFVPRGGQDILHEVIERPEHPGRVSATGKGVEIQRYFVLTPRNSSSSYVAKTNEELVTKIGNN